MDTNDKEREDTAPRDEQKVRHIRTWDVDEEGKATLVTPEVKAADWYGDRPENPTPPTVFPLATLDLLGWKFTVSKGQMLLETAPINGTPGLMYLGRGSLEILRTLLDLALDEPEFPPDEEHLMYGKLIQDGSLGVAK